MSVNYVSNDTGETIAVQISIDDWERIKSEYPDVDVPGNSIPQWQKDMINKRLRSIEDDPQSIMDIDGLFEELDREID